MLGFKVRHLALLLLIFLFGGTIMAANEKHGTAGENSGDLLASGDTLFSSRKYNEALTVYQQAVEKAEAEADTSNLIEALSQVARSYLITDRKEDGRTWLNKAAEVADEKFPPGWSRFLGVKGRFEWQDDSLPKARETFKKMFDYCNKRGLAEQAIDAVHMVAIVGTIEEQIEWGKKGIEAAEKGEVHRWLGPLWNNLGWTYDHEGRYQEALEAYLQAKKYHYLYGDNMNRAIADWAVGNTYVRLGDYDKALDFLAPTLAWAESEKNDEWIGWACKAIGEAEAGKDHRDNALEYLLRAREHLQKAGMPDWDPETFGKLNAEISELQK